MSSDADPVRQADADPARQDAALDAEVLRLLGAGDAPGAFLLIDRALGPKVHGYLRAATKSQLHGEALYEKLRQSLRENLPSQHERLGRIHPGYDKPLTTRVWVFRSMRNLLLNFTGRASRGNRRIYTDEVHVDRGPGPFTLVKNKEEAEKLRQLRESLTEKELEVYVLHVEMELSFAEVADILEIAEGAAKVRFDRAKKRMITRWKELNHDAPDPG